MKRWLMLLVLSLFFGYVYGVEYITECGDITEPGEYVIANDIDASDYFAEIPPGHGRYCIRIMSDDVVLDGNGHTIHSNETYERFRPIYVWVTSGQYNITISDFTLRNGSIVVQNTSLLTIEHVNLSSLIYRTGRDARFSGIHVDSIQVGHSMAGIEEDEVTPTVTNLTVTYSVFDYLSFRYVSNSRIAYSNGSISLYRSVNNHLEGNKITGHHIGISVRGGSNWLSDNVVCGNSVDYKCEESAVLIEEGVNYGEAVEGCDLHRLSLSSCWSECDDHDSVMPNPYLISSWITITSPFTGTSNLYDHCDESDPTVLYEGVCGDVRYEVVNCTEEYGEGFVCEEGACRREGSPPTCSCTDGNDPYIGGICNFYPEGPDHPGEPHPDICTDEYHLTEYYCNGTSITSQEYDCRELGMVCLTDSYGFGYCGEPEEPTCLDSDLGGDDERYLPGMVSFGSDMMNDTCLDNRTLQEAYCGEDGRPATRIITCECVETSDGLGFCQPCVDTDLGEDNETHVPGKIIYLGSNFINDTCLDDTTLSEGYCEDGRPGTRTIHCECATDSEGLGYCRLCSDSDGGYDNESYIPGQVSLFGSDILINDTCIDNHTLSEGYCSEYDLPATQTVSCDCIENESGFGYCNPCVDSDGGYDNESYIPGYITYYGINVTNDTCRDGRYLIEGYCDENGQPQTRIVDCNCTEDDSGLGYCLPCQDSDHDFIDSLGIISYNKEIYFPGAVTLFGENRVNDTCINNYTLSEGYCNGNESTNRTVVCECKEDSITGLDYCSPCLDTDPEQNVSLPGECHNWIFDNISYDYCPSWFSSDIVQYRCCDLSVFECLSGSGICIPETTPCPEGESCVQIGHQAVCCNPDNLWDSLFSGHTTITCSDSDGGLDYLTYGNVSFEGHAESGVCGTEGGDFNGILNDTCVDSSGTPVEMSDHLMEAYCEERTVFFTTYHIPNIRIISCSEEFGPGSHCVNGTCVVYTTECNETDDGLDPTTAGSAESGDLTCSDTCLSDTLLSECVCDESGLVEEIVDCSDIGMVCEEGRCVAPPAENCTDSDGGLVVGVFGSAESGDLTCSDTCLSDTLLSECVCDESGLVEEIVDCSDIGMVCEEGRCVAPPAENCTDSDGGLVVGIFGTAESSDLTCSDTCLSDTLLSECVCGESGLGQETVDCSEMGMVCEGGRCVPTGETEPTCTELEDEENDVHVLGSVMYIDPEGSGFITHDTCNPSDIHSVYQVLCDGNEVSTVLTPCPEGEHCEDGVCVGGSCIDHDGGIKPNIPSSCEDRSGEHPDTCSGDGVIEWYCGSDDLCHSTEVTCEYGCTDGACIYCEDPDGDNVMRLGVCRSTFVNLTDRCDGSMVWEAVCMDGTCVYLDGKQCPRDTACIGGRCVPDWWFPPQGPISLPNLSIEDIHGYMVD